MSSPQRVIIILTHYTCTLTCTPTLQALPMLSFQQYTLAVVQSHIIGCGLQAKQKVASQNRFRCAPQNLVT